MKESIGVGYYRLNIPTSENQSVDKTEVNRIVEEFTQRFDAAMSTVAGKTSVSVSSFDKMGE